MELPANVLIHNPQLGLKGQEGRLYLIGNDYYEVEYAFGGNNHRVLLPIAETALIFSDPVDVVDQIEVVEPLQAIADQ